MRKVETTVYDYNDMTALEEMTPEKVIEILKYAYRGYINKYVCPMPEKDEYSETEYYNYELECAFLQAYKYLDWIDKNSNIN